MIWCDRTDTLVHVKTKGNSTNEDEEITTTLEHPFYVDGKGTGLNMNVVTRQLPSATNIHWTQNGMKCGKQQ